MNTAILSRLTSLKIGLIQQSAGLNVLPILGPSIKDTQYVVLDSSTCPLVKVTEVSQGGSVPQLQVDNGLSESLFLMDGQELVGAKQNRIMNTDVLVAAASKLTVPVSCVEAGRWSYTSAQFSPGKAASHTVRAGKHARVAQSLRERGTHDADQAAVWNDVQESLTLSNTASPTAALHDAYDGLLDELEQVRANLLLPSDAVGVVVFHGGTMLGLDVFDRHSTLSHYWQSLIDSYAVDWLRQKSSEAAVPEITQAVARTMSLAAAAAWTWHVSPGLGADYRLEVEEFSGSALVVGDSAPIHFTLFPRGDRNRASDSMNLDAGSPRIHRRRRS